jgi:hypothetical protein
MNSSSSPEVTSLLRPVWSKQSHLLLEECRALIAPQRPLTVDIRCSAGIKIARHLFERGEDLELETLRETADLLGTFFRVCAKDASKWQPLHVETLSHMTSTVQAALDTPPPHPLWDDARTQISQAKSKLGTLATTEGAISDLEIDAVFRTISRPSVGRTVLTSKEIQIMALLKKAESHSLSRDELLSQVWSSAAGAGKVFGVHLLNLRRKIAPLGLGIRFVAPDHYVLESDPSGR